MTKYFTKSEYETITNLLESNDYTNWYLAFDLIKTHPKYKNFKKLIIRNYTGEISRKYCWHLSSLITKYTLEEAINSWLRVINWIKDEGLCGLVFNDIIHFMKKRTFTHD